MKIVHFRYNKKEDWGVLNNDTITSLTKRAIPVKKVKLLAPFTGGKVISEEEISPAWFEVKAFLASDENKFSTCKVSPSNDKYCCDLDIIKDEKGYQWKPGDTFKTKITDAESGYFATEKIE